MAGTRRQSVEISPEAAEALNQIKARTGISNKVIVDRVVQWLAAQHEDVQGPIILAMPLSFRPAFAQMVMEKMAGPETAIDTIPFQTDASQAGNNTGRRKPRKAAKSGPRRDKS